MKKLMLFAMVALAATGYSQEVDIPNVQIKTDSYRSYEIVRYDRIDSTWSPYDSLTMIMNNFIHELYDYDALFGPDTTTGMYFYTFDPVERMVGFAKSKETYDFNFTDSTLTRVVNGKRFTDDIASFYLKYDLFNIDNENRPYQVFVITKDGYERNYYVNFNDGTFEYEVKSIKSANPFETINHRTNVVEFKKY